MKPQGAEIEELVRVEVAERHAVARDYERAGHRAHAERLRSGPLSWAHAWTVEMRPPRDDTHVVGPATVEPGWWV